MRCSAGIGIDARGSTGRRAARPTPSGSPGSSPPAWCEPCMCPRLRKSRFVAPLASAERRPPICAESNDGRQQGGRKMPDKEKNQQ